jgi:hypothetical protein
LIANIFKNERDDDTDGMEQDLGDFGGFGEWHGDSYILRVSVTVENVVFE